MAQLRAASEGGGYGAIAQLGERIVRNDEVGGSIPPGSTSRRRLRLAQVTPIISRPDHHSQHDRPTRVTSDPSSSPMISAKSGAKVKSVPPVPLFGPNGTDI